MTSTTSASASASASSVAFFAIYDPRNYPAFDNAAFAGEPSDSAIDQQRAVKAASSKRRLHLPTNFNGSDEAAAAAERAAGKQKMKSAAAAAAAATAAAAEQADDGLDDNLVLDGGPTEAPAVSGRKGWTAAAAVATQSRRPTLLKLAEAATAVADLSELLSRGLQRQREEAAQQPRQHQEHQHEQNEEQQPFSRGAAGSVRGRSSWWQVAIAEHLNSRAGHHYFNGERDPSAGIRATIRGSLLSYRRGPRPKVIGHFEQPQQPPQPPQLPQQEQEKSLSSKK